MRAERSSSAKQPITVNDKLLDRLGDLVQEVHEAALEQVSVTRGIDKSELSAALANNIQDTDDLPLAYDVRRDEREQQIVAREHRRKIKRACEDVLWNSTLSASVTYRSGTTIKVNEIDQLKTVLEKEDDEPSSVSMLCGNISSGVAFTLVLQNSMTTYNFSVYGDRRSVDHLGNALSRLLGSFTPDYYYLHLAKTQVLLSVILGLIANLSLSYLAFRLKLDFGTGALEVAARSVPVLIAQLGVFLLASNLLEKAFPRCTFEYGNRWRKQKVRKAVLGALATAVLSPLIFEIIF